MATLVRELSPQEKALLAQLEAKKLTRPHVVVIDDVSREPAGVRYFYVPCPDTDGRWQWDVFDTQRDAIDYIKRQRAYWSS